MTKPSGRGSLPPDRQEAERRARTTREAAALRENLHRRKQQSRARKEATPSGDVEQADIGGHSSASDCSSA